VGSGRHAWAGWSYVRRYPFRPRSAAEGFGRLVGGESIDVGFVFRWLTRPQVLGHPPTQLRHLHLDSFVLAESSRAEELFTALKGGPLVSLRFAPLRSRSALKELSAISPLFPQLKTLQIDDFEWTAEVRFSSRFKRERIKTDPL
jgi:hypothetical protein